MTSLTIGQVAKESKTTIDTVRFYERKNLISPASRKASGYRQFHPRVINHIAFIRSAKALGFTLKDIGGLLSIWQNPNATAGEVKKKAREKIADIDAKIKQLTAIREELQSLTDACSGNGPASQCPIIEGIETATTSELKNGN